MTARERFVNTLLFRPVDRIPLQVGGGREKTNRRWRSEGLPEGMNAFAYACDRLGIDPASHCGGPGVPVDFRMRPQFEEKVLEHRDGHYLVQDWMGNITEISDEYDVTYIRCAKDFVTRKWHRFPVENREDFARMKERYDPDDPGRYPDNLDELARQWREGDAPVSVGFSGPFWQLREWCGFEPLCMFFLDDPDFVEEMCTFWGEFVSAVLQRVLDRVPVDRVFINEDMAYKEKPMISPEMTRTFLKPCYDRWVAQARAAETPLVDMDSDGRIDLLIPVWIDAGINVCDPMEVAAGNDIVAQREQFGKRIAFRGGVDKRAMAKGGRVLEAEVNRVCSILDGGGYIPGCDHGIPHDVPLAHFVDTVRLLAERTGWL
ncbi:MAG: uroporphyrinogen decarboxylase family protein [Planctomycetota bacterium]